MDSHIRIIGTLWIVISVIGLLVGGTVAGFLILGGAISGDETALPVTGIVAVFIAALFLAIFGPGLTAGIGLVKFKPWARVLVLVLSFFILPTFPFGTALGIYSLVILFDTACIPFFSDNTFDDFRRRSHN